MMIEEVKDVREKKTSGNKDRMAENGRLGVELWKSKQRKPRTCRCRCCSAGEPNKKETLSAPGIVLDEDSFFLIYFPSFCGIFPFFSLFIASLRQHYCDLGGLLYQLVKEIEKTAKKHKNAA